MKQIQCCPNHPDRKVKSHGLCSTCYGVLLYNSNPEYQERQIKNSREYYLKNKKRFYDSNKRRKESNPERYKTTLRNCHLNRSYGITQEEYLKIFEEQEKKCAICGTSKFDKKGPAIDHCHDSGKVRGILCGKCNRGLGLFMDNINNLKVAIEYLSNNKN